MPREVAFLVIYEIHDDPKPPDGLFKRLGDALKGDCAAIGLDAITCEPMTTKYSVADQGRFRSQRISMVDYDDTWRDWFASASVQRSLDGDPGCYCDCGYLDTFPDRAREAK